MKTLITAGLILFSTVLSAQESVRIDTTLRGRPDKLDAIYRKASDGKAAVVLVHSAGGASDGTTEPIAKKLNDEGISTIEVQFFANPQDARRQKKRGDMLVNQVFDAMKFLTDVKGADSARIGIAGFSMGAHIAIWASSQKLTKTYGGGKKFASHAASYPACWLMGFSVRGEKQIPKLPGPGPFIDSDAMRDLTKSPIRIFAAGRDDYDDRDPNACKDMVKLFEPADQGSIEVVVYDNATHGWNQKTQEFFVPFGCKGKGCINHNQNNPAVTLQNHQDLVAFFKKTLQVGN
jgi:dienelactone hydrolase